jgi:hypothetical protein
MSTYESVGTLSGSSNNGLILTSDVFSAQADDYYLGGVVKINDVYRFVLRHKGDSVTIARVFESLQVGLTLYAYAGCDLDPVTCHTKFNNIYNFGGHEFLSPKDPFAVGVELNG